MNNPTIAAKPAPTQPTEDNGFLAVLQLKEIKDGTLTDLSKKLNEAAVAAAMTGKKASVCLTIGIEPKNGALHFSAKTKTTVPMPEENLCLFYVEMVDGEPRITRRDPGQKEFAFREVPGGKAETPVPVPEVAAAQ